MLLRDNLQPTDFADAELRVTDWYSFDDEAHYRIWICKCGKHWFQQHEWRKGKANKTSFDGWLYSGYSIHRTFPAHAKPTTREMMNNLQFG